MDNVLHENLRHFAHINEIVYDWKFDKEIESIVFTFYNPRKRLKFQKIIHIYHLENSQIHHYIADKIIEEAKGVL